MNATKETANLGALYNAVRRLEKAEERAAGPAQCPLCHAKTTLAIQQARADVLAIARGLV